MKFCHNKNVNFISMFVILPFILIRHPKIGDGVFLGAGSTVLGNIRVGDGAIINQGSVVVKPVNNFTRVEGVPAKVISNLENLASSYSKANSNNTIFNISSNHKYDDNNSSTHINEENKNSSFIEQAELNQSYYIKFIKSYLPEKFLSNYVNYYANGLDT